MLATALVTSLLVNPSAAADSDRIAPLAWRGKRYDLDELPADLAPSALDAYVGWAAWAEEHDYQLTLTDDQRLLLIQHERRRPRAALKLIAETAELVDRLLPLPERPEVEDDGTVRVAPGEAPPAPPVVEPGESWSWSWVEDGGPLETATAVILQLRNEDDQRAALAKLSSDFDYLVEWASTAHERAGFSLERPLCAAWLETAEGQEEWDPEHELINRTAQLLIQRRFGQVPFWLLQGLGWTVEWDLRETLYCFPYRNEFVFEAEHDQWPNDLRREFDDRQEEPLDLSEVARWRRGGFEADPARKAFGLVRFLAQYRPEALTPFVERLRLFRDEHDRLDRGDGSWTRIHGYEVPVEEQQRALLEIAGEDVLLEASTAFRKGVRYRHPKR